MDPLLSFLILLIIICIILHFVPIDAPMKGYIYKGIAFVGCIVLLVWVPDVFHMMPSGAALHPSSGVGR